MWPPARQGTLAVCERCEILVREPRCNLQLEQGRPSNGWRRVGLLGGGWFIGRAKKEGRNSYGGFGIFSMVSRPSSRQVREPVERCCSCTRHSTCSAAGPSAIGCGFRNAGRYCTGCYCWGWCKNQGRFMPSPKMARGLLGIFPRGADPPATAQRATTPPVQSPTSLYLQAIS